MRDRFGQRLSYYKTKITEGMTLSKQATGAKRGTPRKRVKIVQITVMSEDGTSVEVDAKQRTKCGEVKELADYYAESRAIDGRRSCCRGCTRKYREDNADNIRKSGRRYREANTEVIRERLRKYRVDNLKACRERDRKYREVNRQIIRNQVRKWRESNQEHVRKYLKANSEYISEYKRKYRESNPRLFRASDHRRRSLKRILLSEWTVEHEEQILSKFNVSCALTQSLEDIHIDHAIPLAWGHGGSYVGNMIPLSAALNLSKNDAHLYVWFETNRQRFNLDRARFNVMTAIIAEQNGLTSEEYRAYYDWCYANQRTINDICADNERYRYVVSSLELWREAAGIAFPIRLDFEYSRMATTC